jgi:hypothetical protein
MGNDTASELKEVQRELHLIRKKLEDIENIMVPGEDIPETKLAELRRRKHDGLEEYVEWQPGDSIAPQV